MRSVGLANVLGSRPIAIICPSRALTLQPRRHLSTRLTLKATTPPKNPENPIHIYRQILRLAHRLAQRWSDPYIFWTCKHRSARFLGLRSVNGRREKAPWLWALEHVKDDDTTPDGRATSQARSAFKRLKSTLHSLQRAETGSKKDMMELFLRTYAVKGDLRYTCSKALLKSTRTLPRTSDQPQSPYYPLHPPSPILLALLQSPTLLDTPIVQHDPIYRSLIAYYSPKRYHLPSDPGRLSVRKMKQAVEKRVEKMVYPLAFEVVRDLERRMGESTKEWLIQRGVGGGGEDVECGQDLQDDTVTTSSESVEADATTATTTPDHKGPLHPTHPDYIRNKRRTYGALLGHLTSLITPDQIRTSWKVAIAADPSITPSPTTLPPLPPPTTYIQNPSLSLSLHTLWCSKPRLVSQSAVRIYESLNPILAASGHDLPLDLPPSDRYAKGGAGFGKEIARDLMWIYKSPMAIVPHADLAGGHSNVMQDSWRFVSQHEAEMARDVVGDSDKKGSKVRVET